MKIKNTNGRLQRELKPDELEKYVLIKHGIYHSISHNKWDKVGIYQLLNRIMVLFLNQPTAFVIYNYDELTGEKTQIFNTFQDPVNKNNFSKQLKIIEKKYYKLLEKQAIRIYNTDYYFVALKVIRKREINTSSLVFELYPNSHQNILIMRKVLTNAEHNNELYIELDINKYWKSKFDFIANENSQESLSSLQDYVPTRLSPHLELLEPFKYIEEYVLNPSYCACINSPLVSLSGKLPNICFFVRTYEKISNAGTGRYGGAYKYNVRMMIPSKQEELIKEMLAKIRKQLPKFTNKTWSIDGHVYPQFKKLTLRKAFFDLLKGRNGIKKIISILRTPYGKYTRSFVDPIFSTGVINARCSPFQGIYGLDKIEGNHWQNAESETDVLRVAALYYILLMMTPSNGNDDDFSCIVKPLRVGGAHYFCMVSFCQATKESKKKSIITKQHLSWVRNYHGYFDIFVIVGRNIRHKMKRAYLRTISSLAHSICWDVYERGNPNQFRVWKFLVLMNESFYSLCSLAPFNRIEIKPTDYKDGSHSFDFRGDSNNPITIHLSRNPCYSNQILGEYIQVNDIYRSIIKGVERFDNEYASKYAIERSSGG